MTLERRSARESRVRQVMRIMADGNYVSGITPAELEKQWKCKCTTVEQVCGEASRRLEYEANKDPAIRAALITTIQQLGVDVSRAASAIASMGRPNPMALIQAMRLKFDVIRYLRSDEGLEKKMGEERGHDLSGKSDRELLEIIAKGQEKQPEDGK